MLRLRRYRVFLVFTVFFILVFFHFARSRDWSPSPEPAPPADLAGADTPPVSDTKFKPDTPPSPHGFVPEEPEGPPKTDESADTEKPVTVAEEPALNSVSNPVVSEPSPTLKPTGHAAAPKPDKGYDETPPKKRPGDLDSDFGPEGQGRLEVILPDAGLPEPHWKKLPEHFPVPTELLIHLPTGRPKDLPKIQFDFPEESSYAQLQRKQRLATIKEAFEHAWMGYKKEAMGHDEVLPVTGGYRDPFSGWGATLVDALDTLWIMDLKEEFLAALDEVKKIDFTTSPRKDIPVFETVIRYLGGLIGAYDISGHKYSVLLDKAVELAEILIGAFDTPNRMPITYYNWAPDYVSQPHRAGTRVVLAELGSLSMEFTRLAQLTGEDKYYDAIARITNELEKMQNDTRLPGMWPLQLDASGCKKVQRKAGPVPTIARGKTDSAPSSPSPRLPQAPTDLESYKNYMKRDSESGLHVDPQPANYNQKPEQTPAPSARSNDVSGQKICEEQGLASPPYASVDRFGLGGQSDSTYEYLLKEYMLLGGLNDQYRTMYERAMDTVRKYLLFRPMVKDDRDIRFVATVTSSAPPSDTDTRSLKYQYEGTHLTCFAGGMFGIGAKIFDIEGDMDIAAKLTDGCVWAYESTATGIMPETFEVLPCESMDSCTWNETRYWDALDPYVEERIKQAQAWYQRELRKAQQAQKEKAEESSSTALAAPPSHNSEGHISKREVDSAEEEGNEVPTKTLPAKNGKAGSVTDMDVAMPAKPSVLSHEDYVKARIKEDRIPPGFIKISSRKYILRPEAIESVFIMYRLTGDNSWREKGWKMFEAINKHTRTELANSAIKDVTSQAPVFSDQMESFWLAETLKYFYLLFSDPNVVSLDEYVLNTEAHPFKRPGK